LGGGKRDQWTKAEAAQLLAIWEWGTVKKKLDEDANWAGFKREKRKARRGHGGGTLGLKKRCGKKKKKNFYISGVRRDNSKKGQ